MINVNVDASCRAEADVKHHHPNGDTVPMSVLSSTNSETRHRADMPDSTIWTREIRQCPCGERVTLTLRVKSETVTNVEGMEEL